MKFNKFDYRDKKNLGCLVEKHIRINYKEIKGDNMFKSLFTESNGILRGLGCILMIVGELGKSIPEIAPYAEIFTQVGMAIGGTGVVKAALIKK